jgi:WD40 repeat protein
VTKLAGRRRRRRRIAITAGVAVLMAISLVTTSLWRRAVDEVSRREAAQILALGRLELEDRPTAALAHALASLERADSEEARRFAVEALWHGAPAIVLPGNMNTGDFSPDGRWLATAGLAGGLRLWSMDGGPARTLGSSGPNLPIRFSIGSDILATGGENSVRLWSIPEGKEVRRVDIAGYTDLRRGGSSLLGVTETSETSWAVREWNVHDGEPKLLAPLDASLFNIWDIDSTGEWLITAREKSVYLSPLRDARPDRTRLVGHHDGTVVWIASHPKSPRFVSGDESGQVRIWSLSDSSGQIERTFRAPAPRVLLDASDTWMVAMRAGGQRTSEVAHTWNLKELPDADPVVLRNGEANYVNSAAVHPEGQWLFTANAEFGMLWPRPRKYSRVLRGQSPPYIQLAFTPDGKRLVSASDDGTVRLWPLSSQGGERSRVLLEDRTARFGFTIEVDPSGRYALVGSRFDPRVFLVPLQGGEPQPMPGFTPGQGWVAPLAFSPDGRLAVAAGDRPALLRIWDLESGELRTLDVRVHGSGCTYGDGQEGRIWGIDFLPGGSLITVMTGAIHEWDLGDGTSKEIRPCIGHEFESFLAADPRNRRFLVVDFNRTTRLSTLTYYDLETGITREITSHGTRLYAVALDPTGTIAVTGDKDGVLRAGPVTGEEPHMLYGHELEIAGVAISPDSVWIASGSQDGTIRLWPMPEGPPFHTLGYEVILERLRGLTNLRLVPDDAFDSGYRIEVGPFPGWKKLPEW